MKDEMVRNSSSSAFIIHNLEQLERRVEHFSLLYSNENTVWDSALNAIKSNPTLHELDTEPM